MNSPDTDAPAGAAAVAKDTAGAATRHGPAAGTTGIGTAGGTAGELARFGTCNLSDAMDALGIVGATYGIVPRWACGTVAGRARTVLLRRLGEGETAPAGPHLGTRAIEAAGPGDVIVVAHQARTDSGGWGGLLSAGASVRGVAGVVVDGACRDVAEAEALGLPLYARSTTPVSARGRTVEVANGVPVDIAGVRVDPGDWVVADGDGLVVIADRDVDRVLERVREVGATEAGMLAALRSGAPASSVLGRRYETMLADGAPPVDRAAPGEGAGNEGAGNEGAGNEGEGNEEA